MKASNRYWPHSCAEIALFLLFFAVASANCLPCFAAPKLRVGVITPLTGTLVASGVSVRNSVLLAKSLYDKSDLVTFVFEDDSFLPKNSVSIAKKFIEDKLDAIIIFGTPTAFAVVPVTEQAKMPLLAITIVDKVVQGKEYAVRHFVAWQTENRRLIDEVKRRSYKRVAIVTTVNDASLSLRDGFVKDATVEVVLNEEFSRESMDFQAIATKIKSARPDAVYHLLFAPQGSAFMKALRRIGCTVPVFAAHNVEDPSEAAAAEGTYEGIWFVTGDDRQGADFARAYKEKYGEDPAMGWANAFDYAKMLIEAASTATPVLTYLKQLRNFDGAFGHYGAAEGNTFDLKATVKMVRNSRFVPSD